MWPGKVCESMSADASRADLSRYRMQKAQEMLATAERVFGAPGLALADNRAYYAFFHAIRAVLVLDGVDFRKHTAVLSCFATTYLQPGILPREYGKAILNAWLMRTGSDYQDFYVCSVETTDKLLSSARRFCADVMQYLEERYREQR